jgi:hypothetical protein
MRTVFFNYYLGEEIEGNEKHETDQDIMRSVRQTNTEWVVAIMTECDTSGRQWQNEVSATDEYGMSGGNHDTMWYVRQTMTEWDQCDRRIRNEWWQSWQNVIRQADDDRMRSVRQTNTEWVVATMTECDTSGRQWQNEISATDYNGNLRNFKWENWRKENTLKF